MILYNVTCNVPHELSEEWLDWMRNEHLPEVMATGKFLGYNIHRLLTEVDDNSGINFTIIYRCESLDLFDEYNTRHATDLREKTRLKYGDSVLAFRTLMEEL